MSGADSPRRHGQQKRPTSPCSDVPWLVGPRHLAGQALHSWGQLKCTSLGPTEAMNRSMMREPLSQCPRRVHLRTARRTALRSDLLRRRTGCGGDRQTGGRSGRSGTRGMR